MGKILFNGVERDMTADEQKAYDNQMAIFDAEKPVRKLSQIRRIRNEKLIETDYLANSDVTMPDNIKTWRQSLRDIPSNHTDEDAYDLLLARNSDGQLTHSIWSKP